MQDTHWLQRTRLLVGDDPLLALHQKHVLCVGLGGVGSFAAEFVARAGVGKMTIIDGDTVDPTNRNRQLPALASTHHQSKAELMAARLRDINPEIELVVINEFMTPDAMIALMETPFDYVMDCIDSITPKLLLIESALRKQYPLVSSMGAGGKMDPTMIQVSDISKSYNCNMARYVRKRLHKVNIRKGFKAVFSTEQVHEASLMHTDGTNFKRSAYGTISYLPAAFGGVVASVVIRDLVDWESISINEKLKSKK
jgi:tRNA threonylcarbamoyladenosine dehydratase